MTLRKHQSKSFNPFHATSLSLSPENIRQPLVFWCVQGVWKETSCTKWFKYHLGTFSVWGKFYLLRIFFLFTLLFFLITLDAYFFCSRITKPVIWLHSEICYPTFFKIGIPYILPRIAPVLLRDHLKISLLISSELKSIN